MIQNYFWFFGSCSRFPNGKNGPAVFLSSSWWWLAGERGGQQKAKNCAMATRFGPLLAWTVGKAVNESTAAHALRAHHSLSGKCASTLCSTARATSEGSGFWGWKQKATEFHSAARNWVRTCEMQVAEVAKRRTYATKAKGGTAKQAGSGGKRGQALAALQEKEQEALSTFFHEPKGELAGI